MSESLRDAYGRKIEYLRISVTDRCNFRCLYCMPLRSEEHTSELQSRGHLVCRLLLEKKNVALGKWLFPPNVTRLLVTVPGLRLQGLDAAAAGTFPTRAQVASRRSSRPAQQPTSAILS